VQPGDSVAGRYRLNKVIGRGRSGEVWLAHDELVRADVVLKPVRVEGDHDRAAARLRREADALAGLRHHPHVVTLHDIVPGTDPMWMVMEHLPDGSLNDDPQRMPPREAAALGAQIADVLVTLHSRGLIHCDVKPANIGLNAHGNATLLDFGSAYPFREPPRPGETTETVGADDTTEEERPRVGFTPDYAAPELARGFPHPASDVFCLGATLYALVIGHPPPRQGPGDNVGGNAGGWWASSGSLGLRTKARRGVTARSRRLGPLHEVVEAMLQARPEDRPNAAQTHVMLRRVAVPHPVRRRGRTPWWRRPATAATAAALAVAAVLGTRPLLDRDDPEDAGESRTYEVATARELSRALEAARAGDTIRLAPGEYHGTFFTSRQGTAEDPITLTGPREAMLFNPGTEKDCSPTRSTEVSYCGYGLHLNHAAHWNLSGFTVADSKKGIVLDDSQHVTIDGVEVVGIQEEAVHFRTSSSDNVIQNSRIHQIGSETQAAYGAGIVFGSDDGLWRKYGEGIQVGGYAPDRSDRNKALNNELGPHISAEHIDLMEGTKDGVIRGNSFNGHGISGENYADSWLDAKGNAYLIEGNSGTFGGDGHLKDGFQAHAVDPGWGCGNVFRDNDANLGGAPGYGFNFFDQGLCEDVPGGPNRLLPGNSATQAGEGLSNIESSDDTA
jgi:serine/threonine protein kinase